MLVFSNLRSPRHVITLPTYSSSLFFHKKPTNLIQFPLPTMSSSATKVVAEYAKSGRSSCKKCAKTIAAKDLRVGLVSRDARGFDMTRWHHLSCFPVSKREAFAGSVEAIQGFVSLKSSDQENLKALLNDAALSEEEVTVRHDDAVKESEVSISKSPRVRKRDEGESDNLEEKNSKKTKSKAFEEIMPHISFSDSLVKTKYKDATLLPKWKAFQTVIFHRMDEKFPDSGKIAAFDFDGCLAKTSVKRVGADAWSLTYPSIPEQLQRLYKEGFKLVIFTNESNIDRWNKQRQKAVDSKIGRLNSFIKLVKVPIQVFIACGIAGDSFRKPNPGMWHLMEQHLNSGISVDMDQSFYVGDAAGRPDDHSDADIKFAEAIGLKFYVPEEYFGATASSPGS